jgi:hypothetical protein
LNNNFNNLIANTIKGTRFVFLNLLEKIPINETTFLVGITDINVKPLYGLLLKFNINRSTNPLSTITVPISISEKIDKVKMDFNLNTLYLPIKILDIEFIEAFVQDVLLLNNLSYVSSESSGSTMTQKVYKEKSDYQNYAVGTNPGLVQGEKLVDYPEKCIKLRDQAVGALHAAKAAKRLSGFGQTEGCNNILGQQIDFQNDPKNYRAPEMPAVVPSFNQDTAKVGLDTQKPAYAP